MSHVKCQVSCSMYCDDTKAGTLAVTIKGLNNMLLLSTLYPPVCAECNEAFVMKFYPCIPYCRALFCMASWPV